MTSPRVSYESFQRIAPGVVAGLAAITKALNDAGFDKALSELVKLRASQINECAFCLQFHLNAARKLGVPQVKLDLLPVWREAGVFTARESAALAWTEALVNMNQREVSDDDHAAALGEFPGEELAYLTSAIAGISAWNRIAGALRFAPPIPAREGA